MIIFNCDLDNTLIYSYKHDIGKDKVCVEIYNEKEISYMTNSSYNMLHKISEKVLFVPTTTRSIEQYKRINFGCDNIKYALVCNGGILLVNGVIDELWYKESLEIIKDTTDQMKLAIEALSRDKNVCFEIRDINELFIFTKSENPVRSVDLLKNTLDLNLMDVFNNGQKVYAVPKKMNKGNAILRLKEKLDAKMTIAAGDSEFDIPRLNLADISFAPKVLNNILLEEKHIRLIDEEGSIFSDKLLKYVEQDVFEIKH